MAKNLVIFYSRRGQNYFGGDIRDIAKGNTEYCVDFIKKAIGADIFEVETVKEYSKDYMTCTEEAKAETKSKVRPELKKNLESIADYDNIFVCGPCWRGTYPCAELGLLEKLDWTGKNVFGLMTHEGSGLGRSERDLKEICKGANVGRCIAISGSHAADSEHEVADWAKKCVG